MEKAWLEQTFTQSWFNKLQPYITSQEFKDLGNMIALERKTKAIYPASSDVFKAFKLCPFGEVKIVILGMDPYFTSDVADGLAFSCSYSEGLPRKKIQPSLVNLFESIERTVYKGLYLDKDPNLERWAKQGVLLLNTALTVEAGKAESHLALWKNFTKEVLKSLSEYNTGIVYCLWGAKAQQFEKYINPNHNYILKAKHPASSSYTGGVWECNHFVEINKILKENNNEEIIWLMDYNNVRFKCKTKYKHVSEYVDKRTKLSYYKATLRSHTQGYNMTKIFSDIREAAICVDKYLIGKGKEPVNILKRKV